MDIDDFLDRELSELGLETNKSEAASTDEFPKIKESFETSPLVENVRAHLLKGSIDLAEQSYVQLWMSLFQQKLKWNKELYEQLSVLNKIFQSALNRSFDATKVKAERVSDLISRGRAALKEGKKDMPFKIYSEVEEVSASIPDAFFEQKRDVQKQAMEYYKDLRNSTDNELIGRVAALLQELSRLIEKINFSIARNDMVNVLLNYNKSLELYNQIPEGFLRHKNSVAIRLLQIYKTLSIYNEIANLQKELIANIQKPEVIQKPDVSKNLVGFPTMLRKDIKSESQAPQQTYSQEPDAKAKKLFLQDKKERAKKNIEKGFYSEASKDIEEALRIEPNDVEAKAINAKIKTLE